MQFANLGKRQHEHRRRGRLARRRRRQVDGRARDEHGHRRAAALHRAVVAQPPLPQHREHGQRARRALRARGSHGRSVQGRTRPEQLPVQHEHPRVLPLGEVRSIREVFGYRATAKCLLRYPYFVDTAFVPNTICLRQPQAWSLHPATFARQYKLFGPVGVDGHVSDIVLSRGVYLVDSCKGVKAYNLGTGEVWRKFDGWQVRLVDDDVAYMTENFAPCTWMCSNARKNQCQ